MWYFSYGSKSNYIYACVMTPQSKKFLVASVFYVTEYSIYSLVSCFKCATLLFLHDKLRTSLLILFIINFLVKNNYFLCNVVA
jgi:hypothetical protein